MSKSSRTRIVLLASAALLLAGSTFASQPEHLLGTNKAHLPNINHTLTHKRLPPDKPFVAYKDASYATGGVALRNRSTGSIHISGVIGGIQDAYIYWVVLNSVAPTPTQPIMIERRFPGSATITLRGILIATPTDPCWGSTGAAVYRAQIPPAFATGNGLYQVYLSTAAVGLSSGDDPWVSGYVAPAAEGASMVLIGKGTSVVSLYDFFAAEFSGGTFSYVLDLPSPAGSTTLMDSFGADGQYGSSRSGNSATSGETVTVNGTQISGPGSVFDVDSDWNGNSGFPLPQLWDDSGHDVSAAVPSGSLALKVDITAPADCLIPVGNVVSTQ